MSSLSTAANIVQHINEIFQQNHAFSDASMKLGTYICQAISLSENPLATQNSKWPPFFQDGRHCRTKNKVFTIKPDIVGQF